MLAMFPEGNLDALVAVKRLTGVVIRLQTLDEITEIESTDSGIRVWVVTWRMEERKRDVKVTGRGIKLFTMTPSPAGVWRTDTRVAWDDEQVMENIMNALRRKDMDTAQVWEEMSARLEKMGDFETFYMNNYGPGKSVREWIEGLKRERMAGRAGSDSSPMDTYDRTTAGYTTHRMTKHWQ